MRRRPLGLRTLPDLIGESPRTPGEVIESYLLRAGFIARSCGSRVTTERASRALPRAA